MIALLPADAPLDALGEPPDGVELVRLPGTGEPDPDLLAGTGFLVPAPPDRDRLARWLPGMPELRVVQTLNAGVDWVPPLPAHVTLCNSGHVHDATVAEWVIGCVIALQRRLPHYLRRQWAGEWDTQGNTAFAAAEGTADLADTTVLIVGHGSIGRAVEERLRPFGTGVLGVARHPRPGVPGPEVLAELLPSADVVVLLVPATEETRHLVDKTFLDRMRPGAILVNASRGRVVDTDALVEALRARRVLAALDTTDPEPLPPGHPLWSAPGCLVTPHIAGSTRRWRERAYRHAGEQLRRWADGRPLTAVRRHGY